MVSAATGGDFAATVTLTDADNCSTTIVYTGRSAYCNGTGVAKASATAVADTAVTGAKVTAKKVQKQKRSKLVVKVKAGASEAVALDARGSVKFKGLKGKVVLKTVKAKTAAGVFRTLSLGSKSKKAKRAASRRKGTATITVKLTDTLGHSVTKKVKVKVVPPAGKKKRGSK